MGRVLKPLLIVGLVAASILTGGAAALAATIGVSVGAVNAVLVSVALASVAGALGGRARTNLTAFDPKAVNTDPSTPRKLAFGRTPLAMDIRYVEPSGNNQEYIDYIVALAAHKCDAVESIYIEDDLAWTVGGGAQGKFAGYLTIEIILEAGAAAYHTVNAGTIWGSTRRLTGCTTMKIRVKRSDNSKSSQSPFASGIGGRWTVIGRGMPVYDPALDSTVAGGSGSQRANDQTTWAYTASGVARGNNPALQLLAFLLGWKIGGVVSVGAGLAADAIDLPSFAAAAALCDESVALAAGGTQRRYEAGRTFSDADDPMGVVQELLKAMNGELTDDGGRLGLRIAVNDLTPLVTLTDDDFVGGFSWQPQPAIDQQYTVVRGRFAQPDAPALFGYVDYPEVAIPRQSNAPRALTLELTAVQEQRRAERIAKQAAQRSLYQGTFTVTLGVRGWMLKRNMVVAVTSNARGWSAKLFRVRSLAFNDDATIEAVLREEDASIYAWDADESALVTPVAPVIFDSRNAATWKTAVQHIDPNSGLALDTFQPEPGNGTLPRLVASGTARNGDAVTFPTVLSAPPRIEARYGGNAATAGQNIVVRAQAVTTSGFTMRAVSQTVVAGSTITDTTPSAGGTGEPDFVINRSNGGSVWNNSFTYRRETYKGTSGTPGIIGTATIAYFARQGGAWVEIGRQLESVYDGSGVQEDRVFEPGAVDFGTGAEFGISLISATDLFGLPLTGVTLTFVHVRYNLATVTETNLTPSSSSEPIFWEAYL